MFESEPFVALSFKETRSPHFFCLRGGSVIVSPNWLTLSLHERWGVLRRRRWRMRKRKGPKVYREVVKAVCKVCLLSHADHK